MEPQTNGYVERCILSRFVTWHIQHERYKRDSSVPTSSLITQVNQQTRRFGRGDVADSSVRRALSKLCERGMLRTVPKEEISENKRERHAREKFWTITSTGFFEILLIHQSFNEELAALYRRFGSTEWGHAPDYQIDYRNLPQMEYSELQSLAKQFDVPANQSGEEIIEQLFDAM